MAWVNWLWIYYKSCDVWRGVTSSRRWSHLILFNWNTSNRQVLVDRKTNTFPSKLQSFNAWDFMLQQENDLYFIIEGRNFLARTMRRKNAGWVIQIPAIVQSNPSGDRIYNKNLCSNEVFSKDHGVIVQFFSIFSSWWSCEEIATIKWNEIDEEWMIIGEI